MVPSTVSSQSEPFVADETGIGNSVYRLRHPQSHQLMKAAFTDTVS